MENKEEQYPQRKNTHYKWVSFFFFLMLGGAVSNSSKPSQASSNNLSELLAHITVYGGILAAAIWFYNKGDKNGE